MAAPMLLTPHPPSVVLPKRRKPRTNPANPANPPNPANPAKRQRTEDQEPQKTRVDEGLLTVLLTRKNTMESSVEGLLETERKAADTPAAEAYKDVLRNMRRQIEEMIEELKPVINQVAENEPGAVIKAKAIMKNHDLVEAAIVTELVKALSQVEVPFETTTPTPLNEKKMQEIMEGTVKEREKMDELKTEMETETKQLVDRLQTLLRQQLDAANNQKEAVEQARRTIIEETQKATEALRAQMEIQANEKLKRAEAEVAAKTVSNKALEDDIERLNSKIAQFKEQQLRNHETIEEWKKTVEEQKSEAIKLKESQLAQLTEIQAANLLKQTELVDEMNAKAAAQRQSALETLQKDYDKRLEELETKYRKQIAETEKVSKLKLTLNEQLLETNSKHAAELEKAKKELEEAILRERNAAATAQTTQGLAYSREKDALQQSINTKETQLARLQSDLQRLTSEKETLVQELRTERNVSGPANIKQREVELQAIHQQEKATAQREHEKALRQLEASLKDKHEAELHRKLLERSNAHAQLEVQIKELHRTEVEQMNTTITTLNRRIALLEQEQKDTAEKTRTEMDRLRVTSTNFNAINIALEHNKEAIAIFIKEHSDKQTRLLHDYMDLAGRVEVNERWRDDIKDRQKTLQTAVESGFTSILAKIEEQGKSDKATILASLGSRGLSHTFLDKIYPNLNVDQYLDDIVTQKLRPEDGESPEDYLGRHTIFNYLMAPKIYQRQKQHTDEIRTELASTRKELSDLKRLIETQVIDAMNKKMETDEEKLERAYKTIEQLTSVLAESKGNVAEFNRAVKDFTKQINTVDISHWKDETLQRFTQDLQGVVEQSVQKYITSLEGAWEKQKTDQLQLIETYTRALQKQKGDHHELLLAFDAELNKNKAVYTTSLENLRVSLEALITTTQQKSEQFVAQSNDMYTVVSQRTQDTFNQTLVKLDEARRFFEEVKECQGAKMELDTTTASLPDTIARAIQDALTRHLDPRLESMLQRVNAETEQMGLHSRASIEQTKAFCETIQSYLNQGAAQDAKSREALSHIQETLQRWLDLEQSFRATIERASQFGELHENIAHALHVIKSIPTHPVQSVPPHVELLPEILHRVRALESNVQAPPPPPPLAPPGLAQFPQTRRRQRNQQEPLIVDTVRFPVVEAPVAAGPVADDVVMQREEETDEEEEEEEDEEAEEEGEPAVPPPHLPVADEEAEAASDDSGPQDEGLVNSITLQKRELQRHRLQYPLIRQAVYGDIRTDLVSKGSYTPANHIRKSFGIYNRALDLAENTPFIVKFNFVRS